MPDMKFKSLILLGTKLAQSMATGGGATLFTTVSPGVSRITHVAICNPSGSLAGATAYTITGFRAAGTLDLSAMTAGAAAYLLLDNNNAPATEIAANTAVVLTNTTGAAGVTADIYLFGFVETT